MNALFKKLYSQQLHKKHLFTNVFKVDHKIGIPYLVVWNICSCDMMLLGLADRLYRIFVINLS